jgi:serine/threonine protein phosphatase PrpC
VLVGCPLGSEFALFCAQFPGDTTLRELENEADEWVRRAHQQSQSKVHPELLIKEPLFDLAPLTAEPSRLVLQGRQNSSEPHVVKTFRGNYYVCQVQGRAGEDRSRIQSPKTGGVLAFVLDGHSPPGRSCRRGTADLADARLAPLFFDALQRSGHPLAAFRETFLQLQQEIAQARFEDGSTVTICYHDLQAHVLWGATLGDSPATLYRRTQRGLEIHRLAYLESWQDGIARQRLAATAGWSVVDNRLVRPGYPGLAVTRAFGDAHLFPAVSQEPILWRYDLENPTSSEAEPNVLLLASDGLWNWLSEVECGQLVRNWYQAQPTLYPQFDNLAELLIAKARERGIRFYALNDPDGDPNDLIDDITVIAYVDKKLLRSS